MELGPKLRKLMDLNRLSQEGLARQVGVSQNQVSRWARGVNVPDIRQARLIATALRVSVDYLADDAQDDPAPPPLNDDEAWLIRTYRASGLTLDEALALFTRRPTDHGDRGRVAPSSDPATGSPLRPAPGRKTSASA